MATHTASDWKASNFGGESSAFTDLQHARDLREGANYTAALQHYRRAWEASPPDCSIAHDAFLEAGMVLGFMGEFEGSLEALRETVRRWPTSAAAYLNFGKTLLMLGEYDDARPVLTQAVALAPYGSCINDEASKQLDLLRQFGH